MKRDSNRTTEAVIGGAVVVRREPGPGRPESTHEARPAYELMQEGFKVNRQVPLPVAYRAVELDCRYRVN